MKLSAIKKIAIQYGLQADKMKKTELVRAIQAAEGNTACFDSGKAAECDQPHCLWREDCKL